MPDNKMVPGPITGNGSCFKEAVCIDANKIYDSCRDKDCLEDLRVYLTRCGRALVDRAINVKVKSAEVLWVYIDVEAVPFNRGFYTVDVKFFFKVKFDAFLGVGRPCEFEGLCTFDKRVILFGSDGGAKIFSSQYVPGGNDAQMHVKTNMPKATVEVVDPIALDVKVVEKHHCCTNTCDVAGLPEYIGKCFDDELVDDDEDKIVLVTLGLFSIIRLIRNTQLLIPAYDFCIPEKECLSTTDDPCSLFKKIRFPTDEFFPVQLHDFEGAERIERIERTENRNDRNDRNDRKGCV